MAKNGDSQVAIDNLAYLVKLEPRQVVDDIHRLDTDIDHAQEQVKDVPGIPYLLGPTIGIIGNSTLLIGPNLIAIHDPLDSRPAIDNIFIGFIRYVRDGYRAVAVDCGFVINGVSGIIKGRNWGCGQRPGLISQEVVHAFLRGTNEGSPAVHQV